jgi:hypothetical protein
MEQHDLPALADVVLRVADVCEELAISYAIGGAVAVSFWGVPRTTQDADCLVAVPAVAYQRLANALNARRSAGSGSRGCATSLPPPTP